MTTTGPPSSRAASASAATLAAGLGAVLLWSGTAIANKLAIARMDAMTAGVLRSLLAGLLATAFALVARLPRPRSRSQLAWLLLSGTASFAAWPLLLSLGLATTTAGHAALIMAILPVLTGGIGAALERQRLPAGWWLGGSIAVVGTAALVLHGGSREALAGGSLEGDLVILAGTLLCALGYVAGGRCSRTIGTWGTTAWGLSAALTLLVPAFLVLAPRTDWSSVGAGGWGAIAYLTLGSSLLGYAAWFWALGHGGFARIAPLQFLQPVLTLLLAVGLLAETLSASLVLSAATILVGTVLAQRSVARSRSRAPDSRSK